MKLEQVYLQKVKDLGLTPDSLQIEAIKDLQEIIKQINTKKSS